MRDLLIGVHVSISGSIDQAVTRAKELECTTFQIFTRNPRVWAFNELDPAQVKAFSEKARSGGYTHIVAHMPYLPNLASPNPEIFGKSQKTLTAEVTRCGFLKIPYLVNHLGSHMGKGVEVGIGNLVKACREALESSDNQVMILLENMAGTKNSVGSSFENIRQIIDLIDFGERVGVCFDTCHAHAAGYDLRDGEAVDRTLSTFDTVVGLRNIKVLHLNDSKGDLNSNRDRHEHIGEGYIGDRGFRSFINDPRVQSLPMILETPYDDRRADLGNLAKVRELANSR